MASGKEDVGTTWAQARLAFAKQLLEQINLGNMSPAARASSTSHFPPLYLHAIAWWDEHHKKIMCGHTSKNEVRIRRDSKGKAAEGVLPPEKPRMSVKYSSSARLSRRPLRKNSFGTTQPLPSMIFSRTFGRARISDTIWSEVGATVQHRLGSAP